MKKIQDKAIGTSGSTKRTGGKIPQQTLQPQIPKTEGYKLKNYYKFCEKIQEHRQNPNPLALHHPTMTIIVGQNAAGKTGFGLFNVLLNDDCRLMWDRLWIFCRFPDEPLYKMLQEHIHEAQAKIEEDLGEPLGYDMLTISSNLEELPTFEELTPLIQQDIQCCMIFDDFMHADRKNLNIIKDYFTWIRKCNISCFFLAQHNTKIDRTIRENVHNVILFYHAQATECKILARDYACELPTACFVRMLQTETRPENRENRDCLLIDMNQSDMSLKFRKNILTPLDFRKYMTEEELKDLDLANEKSKSDKKE